MRIQWGFMSILSIPAVCPRCEHVFRSGFSSSIGATVIMSNNKSSCPRCGTIALVPDGMMRAVQNGIALLSGPDVTAEVLKQVGMLVADLRSGKKSIAEAKKTADAIHPEFGLHFREVTSWGAGILTMFLTLWMAVVQWMDRPGQNRTVNEVAVEAFESAYQQDQPLFHQKPPSSQGLGVNSKIDPEPHNRKERRAAAAKNKLDLKRKGHNSL